MHRIQIKHKAGGRIVHFQNTGNGELTLCGLDWLHNDPDAGHSAGSSTVRTVTCEKCQQVVKACKQVNADIEISHISR
jgi:hypothetical protein